MIRRFVLHLAQKDFVRKAMDEEADLSAFKERPSLRIIAGVSAILLSYVIGWPAVALIGVIAAKLHEPWLAAIGCPLIYGLSHVVFILGMYLAGATYSMIFLRWLTRVGVEKLLAWTEKPSGAG
ncbi:MAG TPA: hypothetical protein ENK89_02660 [Desulfobulbaceae bacterium]|nr:hypothetical protein [Desulfobulbaceae bacterium]